MKLKQVFLIILLNCLSELIFAQSKNVTLPDNWYNLDLVQDGYFGISTEKAYKELLINKKPKKKIIVAVIDGGIDIGHEDLKDVIWTNLKEISGNGIDDDGNGYIDDVHGWNFIGSKKGDLAYDNLELVRLYKKYKPKYGSTIRSTVLDSVEKLEYALYNKVTADFGRKYDEADQSYRYLYAVNKVLDSVAVVNNKKMPTLVDIENYKADDEMEENVKRIIRSSSRKSGGFDRFYKEMKDAYKQYDIMIRYNLNLNYDERASLVGDDYDNSKERKYGNNDVKGPNADHGSHVAGIIGANRANTVGIKGVSNSILIMPVRVVPEGDERDKDVANGIRYAVDNGAHIINMSFGKSYKWDKAVVDSAVKYAEKKGVLIVHAAGNDNLDLAKGENYPNKYFESNEAIAYRQAVEKNKRVLIPLNVMERQSSKTRIDLKALQVKNLKVRDSIRATIPHAQNWIEVGASSYKNDDDLKASFSNYGKYDVDVFAPGFMIKSTVPGSKYEENDGTSMAAPVVSGLAALVLSYYPELKPNELRDIIMKSVVKVDHKIKYKDEQNVNIRVPFSDICVSGGVVNVFNTLNLADSYSSKVK